MKLAIDKRLHVLGGCWIGSASYPAAFVWLFVSTGVSMLSCVVAVGFATLAGFLVGLLWEAWNRWRNRRAARLGLPAEHKVEWADVRAGIVGAFIGAMSEAVLLVSLAIWLGRAS